MSKICTKCKVEKLTTEFYKLYSNKDHLQNKCVDCSKKYAKENADKIRERQREYKKLNKERMAIRDRNYYLATIEEREKYRKEYNKINVEKIKKRRVKYKEINIDNIKKANRLYEAKNKDRISSYIKKRRLENIEQYKEYQKRYIKENKGKINARTAKRRAKRNFATPSWLTDIHLEEIRQLYIQAAKLTEETNTIYHVDHIIPIQGKTVCGLHVPWNLQILTAYDNLSKSNKVYL